MTGNIVFEHLMNNLSIVKLPLAHSSCPLILPTAKEPFMLQKKKTHTPTLESFQSQIHTTDADIYRLNEEPGQIDDSRSGCVKSKVQLKWVLLERERCSNFITFPVA